MVHGGKLLVDSLIALGAKTGFGVPGESYLAVLDALHDTKGQLDFVLCRNEGGASFMAAAHGKLTGQPGICFVTRGPGATNASIGVHTAHQDSAPMLLFVGQVGVKMKGREAFQEVDYRAVFGTLAKWAVEIDQVERIPEILSRAWKTAVTGRPGPVVIALPEDMLTSLTDTPPLRRAPQIAAPAPSEAALSRLSDMFGKADKPLLLLGGSNWNDEGRSALQEFAEASGIPTICAFRFQDQFDNFSRVFCGEAGVGMHPYVKEMIKQTDLLLAVNVRFGEMSTDGYTLLEVPVPKQKLVHVHTSSGEIGKIYQPDLGIVSDPNEFAKALSPVSGNWADWLNIQKTAYEDSFNAPAQPSPVDMVEVCKALRSRLPDDVIVTNGAGNFAVWPNKFIKYGPNARMLGPQSGAMGYGLPAAIAAKHAFPERTVLCFAGDGDFQMNCQELATAKQHNACPVVLIVNNGVYGTIRAHQENHYPGRVSGTTMESPDFAALARSYGLHGERVERTGDFEAAFDRALASTTGAVLDLNVAAEAITPRKTLSQIRVDAQNRAAG